MRIKPKKKKSKEFVLFPLESRTTGLSHRREHIPVGRLIINNESHVAPTQTHRGISFFFFKVQKCGLGKRIHLLMRLKFFSCQQHFFFPLHAAPERMSVPGSSFSAVATFPPSLSADLHRQNSQVGPWHYPSAGPLKITSHLLISCT